MPINTTSTVRVIISEGKRSHVVYEHDDGYTKTLCNKLIRGGRVVCLHVRKVPRCCSECIRMVRMRNKFN